MRARTASRHPGLRLLLFGLALLLVKVWLLYCQVCAVSGADGGRLQLSGLTLASLALALESAVVARCGLRPIEQAMPVAKVT